jgi:predicted GIY-YIG superfamily endonuclease
MPVMVYALQFQSGEIYIGMTSEIGRRLEEHRRRQSPSTRRFTGEFELIYTRDFPDHKQGRTHEKYLKSGAGLKLLQRQDVERPEERGFVT